MSRQETVSGWHFGDSPCPGIDHVVVTIPASVKTKQALFEAFDSSIGLPDYFGENWDAFEECIRDLSWVSTRRVIVSHDGMPFTGDHDLVTTYLSILSGAIEKWRGETDHDLEIWFPRESESTIKRILDEL